MRGLPYVRSLLETLAPITDVRHVLCSPLSEASAADMALAVSKMAERMEARFRRNQRILDFKDDLDDLRLLSDALDLVEVVARQAMAHVV